MINTLLNHHTHKIRGGRHILIEYSIVDGKLIRMVSEFYTLKGKITDDFDAYNAVYYYLFYFKQNYLNNTTTSLKNVKKLPVAMDAIWRGHG
jgi:hypothetical protein